MSCGIFRRERAKQKLFSALQESVEEAQQAAWTRVAAEISPIVGRLRVLALRLERDRPAPPPPPPRRERLSINPARDVASRPQCRPIAARPAETGRARPPLLGARLHRGEIETGAAVVLARCKLSALKGSLAKLERARAGTGFALLSADGELLRAESAAQPNIFAEQSSVFSSRRSGETLAPGPGRRLSPLCAFFEHDASKEDFEFCLSRRAEEGRGAQPASGLNLMAVFGRKLSS